MKKILISILLVTVLILGIAAGVWYFHENYWIFQGQVYARNITSLNLSGQTLTELEKLEELTQLRQLDVTDTGLTTEEYDALRFALPQCEIRWSVPFQNGYYPDDTTRLTITELTSADIAQLAYFPQLSRIDASGCSDHAMLMTLRSYYPDLQLTYLLDVGAKQLPQNTTHLVLGDGTLEELVTALACLPQLQWADASGCRDYAALEALQELYPNCTILYQVEVGGRFLSRTVGTLNLSYDELAQLESVLPYLPYVTKVNVTGSIPSNDAMLDYQERFPKLDFCWSFRLCGLEVTSLDTIVDLSNIPMESTQEVESALKYFRRLERVIMCDCGISNEDMDALGQRNPDVRFVWSVQICPGVVVRTDITYFMPYQHRIKLTDETAQNLRYCVDIECIDLGHNPITDISFMENMTKMKYLVLGDTQVRDISVCANMTELVYAEFFMTNVRDYSPLLNCTNLVDLNVSYALPRDITIFYQMTWLEHLWMRGYWDYTGQALLQRALPNTTFAFGSVEDPSSTGSGWRELQNYYDMRDLMGMHYMTG